VNIDEYKKQYLYSKIWGLGLIRTGVKFFIESAIFGIADTKLPIHYATFMGLR